MDSIGDWTPPRRDLVSADSLARGALVPLEFIHTEFSVGKFLCRLLSEHYLRLIGKYNILNNSC